MKTASISEANPFSHPISNQGQNQHPCFQDSAKASWIHSSSEPLQTETLSQNVMKTASISEANPFSPPISNRGQNQHPAVNPIPNRNNQMSIGTRLSPPVYNRGQNKDQYSLDSVVDSLKDLEVDTIADTIAGYLEELGFELKRDWLKSCISEFKESVDGFLSFDVAKKGNFIINRAFVSGDFSLPENVQQTMHADLTGPFILKVHNIVDLTERQEGVPSQRCLKLQMVDGSGQSVIGFEYRPILDLPFPAPPGDLMVIIRDVSVWHGFLTLMPGCLVVLCVIEEDLQPERKPNDDNSTSKSSTQGSRKPNAGCNPSCYTDVGKITIHKSCRTREITYLASLFAELKNKTDGTTFIQSYIRCIMTGIKLFWLGTDYYLVVYVHDGSFTSEVRIHHKVVETRIGYSLSSLHQMGHDKMMKIITAFQSMLSEFKGLLLVEIKKDKKDSTDVVALDMIKEEGSSFDASWIPNGEKTRHLDDESSHFGM